MTFVKHAMFYISYSSIVRSFLTGLLPENDKYAKGTIGTSAHVYTLYLHNHYKKCSDLTVLLFFNNKNKRIICIFVCTTN